MTATQTQTFNVTLAIEVPVGSVVSQDPIRVAIPVDAAPKALRTTRKAAVTDVDLHRVNLEQFLRKQVGRFVGLDFVKVDGTGRSLNGRLGVTKHLKGGTNTVQANDRPYLVVYDVKTPGYRAVNLATVSMVRAQNTRYHVIG